MDRKARTVGALKIAAAWTILFFIGSFLTRNDEHGFWGVVGGIFWFGFLLGLLAVIVLGVLTAVAAARGRRASSA